ARQLDRGAAKGRRGARTSAGPRAARRVRRRPLRRAHRRDLRVALSGADRRGHRRHAVRERPREPRAPRQPRQAGRDGEGALLLGAGRAREQAAKDLRAARDVVPAGAVLMRRTSQSAVAVAIAMAASAMLAALLGCEHGAGTTTSTGTSSVAGESAPTKDEGD